MKRKYSKSGFTLLEVMLVVSIIAILGIVSITTVRVGKVRNNLNTAQREVASAIKLAQSYALQGKITSNDETPCGFGLVFTDESHYQIFYVPAGSLGCEKKNGDASYRQYDKNKAETLEEYEVKNNIVLDFEPTDKATDFQIYFTVPHGNIYDKNGSSPFGGMTITLADPDGDMSRDIVIDKNGLIEESNDE